MKRCLSVQFFFFLEMIKRDEYIYFMSVRNLRIGLVVFKSMLQGRQEWGSIRSVNFFFFNAFLSIFTVCLLRPPNLYSPFPPTKTGQRKRIKKKKKKKQKEVRGCDTVFNEHY